MLEEVNRLTALVDSLLTISRVDAGHIQLHPTLFPAMDLVREATALFEALIEEKGLQLAIGGDQGATLHADRVFLRQAVVNIMHNAVKYSPRDGSISVSVQGSLAGDIHIEVADSGPGIPPEHAARIFDRFYRVDESRSSGCIRRFGIVPTAIRRDDRVSLLRSPAAALVGASPMVRFKDWLDHRPGCLDRVLTGEERSIASHGVAQKALVGRFLSQLFFEQVELSLLADEFLPGTLTRAARAIAALGESRKRR
jgi:hypothetical protein